MRGYDQIEVDSFLEMISDQLEQMIREKKDLSDDVLKLKTQLRDYQSVEITLKDTLLSAQESMKESRENSNREAELLIQEAELKADKILENAKLNLAEMKNELVVIRAQKDSFARRLRHLLESQLELIDVLDMDDLGFRRYEGEPPDSRKPAKAEPRQEKMEFDSIEDVLPGDDESAEPTIRKVDVEPPSTIGWGERTAPKQSSEPEDDESGQSRISDKLIF